MRVLTLSAAILGCVTLVEAQAPGSELARMNAQISWLFSSGRLQADVIQRGTEATTFQLRGDVTIAEGGTTIMADEANVEISPDGTITRYDLTGNVHVIVEKRR